MKTNLPASWVPDACTLPTAERPLRVAEFDGLFSAALRAFNRVSDTRLTLVFETAPGRAALVRDLASRETACCSFFRFEVADGDPLRVEVHVPPAQAHVLDGLAERADRARAITA